MQQADVFKTQCTLPAPAEKDTIIDYTGKESDISGLGGDQKHS